MPNTRTPAAETRPAFHPAVALDSQRRQRFGQQMVGDLAAAYAGVMTNLGHELGLWRALAGAGPLTSAVLAERAGCAERYVREWLSCQAATARRRS